jgi:BASS family bile acid:Na+ symporter
VIAKNRDNILEATMLVLAAVVILNIYGLIAGYSVGSAFKMNSARRRTLSIEIGMQNAGLGTVLATVHFADQPAVAIPAAVFVFVCIITAAIMVEFWNRNNKAMHNQNGESNESSRIQR